MARSLRIELAGGLYHVTSRGDRREDIYLSEEDRADWLKVVGEVCARFNWRKMRTSIKFSVHHNLRRHRGPVSQCR